jgi:hypothetical protein
MHKYTFVFILLVLWSCKNENTTTPATENQENQSVLYKIANAYGIEKWDEVEEVNFSFVVNPGENESERTWKWEPKINQVTLYQNGDVITYSKNNIDEGYVDTDKAFVNDSFWLLFPFHLVWDDIDYTFEENAISPLNQAESSKLIVRYPKEGGYTPGDRYDIYLNEDFHIIEWSYHPRGQEEPGLINTFEDLSNFDGIYVNLVHSNPNSGFQLVFRDVSFK